MGRKLTEVDKVIAKYAGHSFGGDCRLRGYFHDTEPIEIRILRCEDRPFEGITSWSTIGLSEYAIPWGDSEFPTRIELAGACASDKQAFANILASAAFHSMRSGDVYHPGAAIENYVRLYFPDSPLPHLYFTSPFSWDLRTFGAGSRTVTWLQAMPISAAERDFLKSDGDIALEQRFSAHAINVYDLNRPSVA